MVLVLRAKDAEPGRKVVDTVGRVFMEARIAVMSDKAEELEEQTVRIVVGVSWNRRLDRSRRPSEDLRSRRLLEARPSTPRSARVAGSAANDPH